MNEKYLTLSIGCISRSASIKSVVCGLAFLASGHAFAATITSAGTGNWNNTTTWVGSTVPLPADDVVIANTHTVTVNTNVSIVGLTVNTGATLNFSGSSTLTVGANGIKNQGTFNATNAGAITASATAALTQGVFNEGTFTMGSGTLTSSGTLGLGIENDNGGTFTGGTGLITITNSFRNGYTTAASFTVGSGGMAVSGAYYPDRGTITLNGNVMIGDSIQPGTATISGAGKMVLTDVAHSIVGPVNVHNLETATFTAARTLTLSGTVTATGTTKLNGSATGTISFSGGTFTPATTAYYCTSSTTTGIACSASAPPLVSAPVDFSFNHQQPKTFATEIDLK